MEDICYSQTHVISVTPAHEGQLEDGVGGLQLLGLKEKVGGA